LAIINKEKVPFELKKLWIQTWDPNRRRRIRVSNTGINSVEIMFYLAQVNSSAVQVLIENVQNLDRAYEFAER
jgi:hypothetical protein